MIVLLLDECCMDHFAGGVLRLTEKNRMELVQKQPLENKENTLVMMVVLALGSQQ